MAIGEGMRSLDLHVQVMFVHYLNLAMLIYQGGSKPKKYRFFNRLAMYDEFLIIVCCLHLNSFTNYVHEYETRYLMGWSLIIFINLHLWVSVLFVISDLVWIYRYLIKKLLIKMMVYFDWQWLRWVIWPVRSFREWCERFKPEKPQENLNPFLIVKDFTEPTPEVKEPEPVTEKASKAELDPYQPTHFLVNGKL